jgi:hypothetical protein
MIDQYRAARCLRYLRNQKNLGFDGNILNLLKHAAGNFLWLLGDDDKIDAGQIAEVRQLLEDNPETALFYVNYCHDTERKVNKTGPGLNYFKIQPQPYADRFLYRATLISTNILNMDYCRKLSLNPICISKGWIHLHLLLLLIDWIKAEKKEIIIIKDKIVIQGSEAEKSPMAHWIKFFIDNFSFILDNTTLKYLDTRGFRKGFYDINVRLRYLNLADILCLDNPRNFSGKVEALFRPNVFARTSFYLQYLISRAIVRARGGKLPRE